MNKNDILGLIISFKNGNNDVDVNKLLTELNITNLDLSEYIKYLENEGYAKLIDSNTLHLYPWGISAYIPDWKRNLLWIAKLLILTLKNLILYVGGILSGIIVAYATFLINEML